MFMNLIINNYDTIYRYVNTNYCPNKLIQDTTIKTCQDISNSREQRAFYTLSLENFCKDHSSSPSQNPKLIIEIMACQPGCICRILLLQWISVKGWYVATIIAIQALWLLRLPAPGHSLPMLIGIVHLIIHQEPLIRALEILRILITMRNWWNHI